MGQHQGDRTVARATILAAVIGGLFVVVAAIIGILPTILNSHAKTLSSPSSNSANISASMPLGFHAQLNNDVTLYSEPASSARIKIGISQSRSDITVFYQVEGQILPDHQTNKWYLVEIADGDDLLRGYIYSDFIDLTGSNSNQLGATPPLVTLTPTPS